MVGRYRKPIGIGVIGLGQISKAHIRGYQEARDYAPIVAVCDVNAVVAEERATALGCTAYTDYRDLLRDPHVEAVDVTLPHYLHYAVARAALESGKHVLVEKPMAASSEECRILISIAQARSLKFTVAENTRFVAAYQETQKMLMDGPIGTPRLIRTLIYGSEVDRLRDTRHWKGRLAGSKGGTVIDAGPHSFYLLKWLFGEIESVQAFTARVIQESEVEDYAVVAGQLRNGSRFTTEYTFTAEIPWGERLEIYGSAGTLIVDQLCNPPAVHHRSSQDYAGVPLPNVPYDPLGWKEASVAAGVRDFVQAVHEDRSTSVDPIDGAYALRIVEAAYASVAASGTPVRVSDDAK